MNKKLKTFGISSGLLVVSVAPIIATVSAIPNQNESTGFVFMNRYFNNVDEVIRFLVQKEIINIEDTQVLGDLGNSYANFEQGRLNPNLLPEYDPNKIDVAYLKASGELTSDYEKAKKTYFNPGNKEVLYDDGFGHLFESELQAQRSMSRNRIDQSIGYYEMPAFTDGGDLITTRLNPLNLNDINDYKDHLSDNITNILMENIDYESNYGRSSKSNWNNLELEFVNPRSSSTSNTFDLANYIEDQSPYIHYNSSSRKLYWNDYYYQRIHWSSRENGMGGGYSFNNSANWSTRLTTKNYGDSDFVLNVNTKYHYKRYGRGNHNEADDRYNKWTDWRGGYIYDGSESTVRNVLNMVNSNFLTWNNSYSKVSNLADGHSSFYNTIQNSYYKLNSKNPSDIAKVNQYLNTGSSTNTAILNNPGFSDFYSNLLRNKLGGYLSSMRYPSISDTYSLYYYNMPDPRGMFAQNTYWAFKGWKQTVKVNGTFHDNVKYWAKNTWNYSLPYGGKVSLPSSRTLNEIMNWGNSGERKKVNIKYRGVNLFEGTLAYQWKNNKYQIGLVDLKINPRNQLNNYGKNLLTNNKSYSSNPEQQKLWDLLTDFVTDLRNIRGTDEEKVANIFKKYFESNNLPKNLIDYVYQVNFNQTDQLIETSDILKMYFNNLRIAYNQYATNPKTLLKISNQLILPKEIFLFDYSWKNSKNYLVRADYGLHPGKFKLTSIDNYIPEFNKGFFSMDKAIAQSKEEWEDLKDKYENNLPSQVLIYYDENSEPINIGNYDYDQKVIIKYNADNMVEPKKDYNHVFVEGFDQAILNKVHWVQKLTLEDQTYYFNSFANLKAYLETYITQAASWDN